MQPAGSSETLLAPHYYIQENRNLNTPFHENLKSNMAQGAELPEKTEEIRRQFLVNLVSAYVHKRGANSDSTLKFIAPTLLKMSFCENLRKGKHIAH
jgi:hypothetical protein